MQRPAGNRKTTSTKVTTTQVSRTKVSTTSVATTKVSNPAPRYKGPSQSTSFQVTNKQTRNPSGYRATNSVQFVNTQTQGRRSPKPQIMPVMSVPIGQMMMVPNPAPRRRPANQTTSLTISNSVSSRGRSPVTVKQTMKITNSQGPRRRSPPRAMVVPVAMQGQAFVQRKQVQNNNVVNNFYIMK